MFNSEEEEFFLKIHFDFQYNLNQIEEFNFEIKESSEKIL